MNAVLTLQIVNGVPPQVKQLVHVLLRSRVVPIQVLHVHRLAPCLMDIVQVRLLHRQLQRPAAVIQPRRAHLPAPYQMDTVQVHLLLQRHRVVVTLLQHVHQLALFLMVIVQAIHQHRLKPQLRHRH